MFILFNVNPNKDLVTIYDSTDNTNEPVKLSVVANQVLNGSLKVYGIRTLNNLNNNCTPIRNFGIAINQLEAKQAFARVLMQKNKLTKEQAYKQVGL